jgi:hypothetical protein
MLVVIFIPHAQIGFYSEKLLDHCFHLLGWSGNPLVYTVVSYR